MTQWFYSCGGVQQGPVKEEQLAELARRGELKPDDFVWKAEYGQQWRRAATVETIFAPGSHPAPAPTAMAALPYDHGWKGVPGVMPYNGDITAAAREALRGRWGFAVGFTLLYAVIAVALSAVGASLGLIAPWAPVIFSWVVTPCLTTGMAMVFLGLARKGDPSVVELFHGFPRILSSVGAYFLTALFSFLWSLAALLPVIAFCGVYYAMNRTIPPSDPKLWDAGMKIAAGIGLGYYVVALFAITLRYSLVFFAVADRDCPGPLEAVSRSVLLMRRRKLQFLFLMLRFIGWSLLALLTCGLGLFWVFPYGMTAVGIFYDRAEDAGRT